MRRLILRLFVALLLLILLLTAFIFYTVRRSFPDFNGEIKVAGLKNRVKIVRDKFGIPQIYASSRHDLFFAQGYVHAQDRFWQMDVWRHIGSGRLSEMFGKSQIETDRFLRTLGWRRVAQQEVEQTDPNSRAILDSYAAGVNAYLKEHSGAELSLEYALLGLSNRGYQVEPWQPVHSATFGKVMAWDLCMNMNLEIQRAVLSKTLTREQIEELYPPYDQTHVFVVPETERMNTPDVPSQPQISSAAFDALQRASALADSLKPVFGSRNDAIGSNNWVISGKLTDTGKPYLANDPHLGTQMPSIWYQAGLHCEPVGPDCPFDVSGFSFAGVPGIIIGHNARIAWGFTNVGADVMDLYVEKINPQNSNQYSVNDVWQDMQIIRETIKVSDADSVEINVRITRHGPVISDSYSDLNEFKTAGKDPYAIALKWTALQPANTFPAIWKMNLAQNWDDFRSAAADFDVPSQNMVYADVDGNIGYQTPGKIPVRKSGDGRMPVNGWTDDYEWTGFIPFDQLPTLFNPERGYIVSANNAVASNAYPFLIATDWEPGSRAGRIVEMIRQNNVKISIGTIRKMQGDNRSPRAPSLVPHLLRLNLNGSELKAAQNLLREWDFQQNMDSAACAIFESFWKHLLAKTFHDDLPEKYWPGGSERWAEVFRLIVDQPQSSWWDNKKTPEHESRDEILAAAFTEGVRELEQTLGPAPARWKWGSLHTVTFRNETLGQSGITLIEALLNRGPYETSGGSAIVNATSWNPKLSFEVTALPSMRMIVNFNDLDRSLTVHTTGQSGHAFHSNYIDMADLWRNINYYDMHFTKTAVDASAVNTLQLIP